MDSISSQVLREAMRPSQTPSTSDQVYSGFDGAALRSELAICVVVCNNFVLSACFCHVNLAAHITCTEYLAARSLIINT